MNEATLRLFSALQVQSKELQHCPVKDTIREGYIFDPAIIPNVENIRAANKIIGLSANKANASFHKSWAKVRDASIEQLVLEQIIHYVTTYGFESLGVYNETSVYIPNEQLDAPEIDFNIPLIYVKALTADEILEKIINLGSGVALAQETLEDIMTIVRANKYGSDFVEHTGNRELKGLLYDYYDIAPTDPVEYLRYLVLKLTDESLLIKNEALIEQIEGADGQFLDQLLKHAPNNLASIFYRYKPLFLAMKKISNNKTFFNQLRKKAKKQYKPLSVDFLNSITTLIKTGSFDTREFEQKLPKYNLFRKIRLAYALQYRLAADTNSIVYRIRNGKAWATEFFWDDYKWKGDVEHALHIVRNDIIKTLQNTVAGKTIYIPGNIHYTLPATEKSFIGNIPSGSYVTVPEDVIVGIHWFNNEDRRVDLDLSMNNLEQKLGWDAGYRTGERTVLFSGDMTDAPKPNGASELFYFKKGQAEPWMINVNDYNFVKNSPVECKFFVASEKPGKMKKNYMVNPNNIVAQSLTTITKQQTTLGMVLYDGEETRVYFSNFGAGKSITTINSEADNHAYKYMVNNSLHNFIDLGDVLGKAGAEVITEPIEGEYLDLSPKALDKTTLLNLFGG